MVQHAADGVHLGAVDALRHSVLARGVGGGHLTADTALTEEQVGGVVDELTSPVRADGGEPLAGDVLPPSKVVLEDSQQFRSAFSQH